MKKLLVLFLALLLLAVPAFGSGYLVSDGEGLLTYEEAAKLEELYGSYSDFTPVLVTVDSFGGRSAADFAGRVYDQMGYPYDGILLLVSLTEGEWYILTNGACYARISDYDADNIGQTLVPLIQDGDYYEAFARFPELAAEIYSNSGVSVIGGADSPTAVIVSSNKNYGKTIAIRMGAGLLIGLIVVGIMASRMKSVKMQLGAADYVRPGSMQLTNQRDIFLYSHVTRTPRPKSNSSGGSHGGGSRGGAGGRL